MHLAAWGTKRCLLVGFARPLVGCQVVVPLQSRLLHGFSGSDVERFRWAEAAAEQKEGEVFGQFPFKN